MNDNHLTVSRNTRLAAILIAVFVIIFLLQRGGLVFFGYSHISHPYFDEPVSGTLTHDLLEGQLRAPLFVYQYENRSGDSLMEGLLMYPLYRLFGPSMFSMKLFALLSSLLCLILWILFLRRYCGIWAALVFTALFALPPPMFARLNLVGTLSSHHMLNPIVPLQLLFLFRIMVRDRTAPSSLVWIGFGFICGLGSYTFYSYIIFNVFCLLFLIVFRPERITLRAGSVFFLGLVTGFAPWIYRSLYSSGGGSYMRELLGGTAFSPWSFIQSFGFNVPHSLGYGYPGREIGMAGVFFTLFMLICFSASLAVFLVALRLQPVASLRNRLVAIPTSQLPGIFMGLFLIFFLSCLSLSSKQIDPVEYWPYFGLYATFAPSDLIRYRWMHVIYPFYFAIVAVATGFMAKANRQTLVLRIAFCGVIIFFLMLDAWKSVGMYSTHDRNKLFYYKGYSYDLMAPRLIMSDFAAVDDQRARQITDAYPLDNRPTAWESLASRNFVSFATSPDMAEKLNANLDIVPKQYIRDFIYGVMRTLNSLPVTTRQAVIEVLAKRNPELVYENWGYRHLAHKYYGFLLNREILFDNIPAPEQFFFKTFFDKMISRIQLDLCRTSTPPLQAYDPGRVLNNFLADIQNVPTPYQDDAVKGIGKLIGAEMLFDPLATPDYPLDSSFGLALQQSHREAFYQGMGAGFGETLCRYWRRLMPPEEVNNPDRFVSMLDIEWQRCINLMLKLPAEIRPLVQKGFVLELNERNLNPTIKQYLLKKLAGFNLKDE